MRISTATVHTAATQGVVRGQADLVRLQQQLSSGRRILTPSDDPIGTARAVVVESARETNDRYRANQTVARNQVSLSEQTLGSASDLVQSIRERLLQGANGTLTQVDRRVVATELRALQGELLNLANTRDADGGYIFAGYGQSTQPFTAANDGAQYNGDQGQRFIQVGTGEPLPVSQNGTEIFETIRRGNGTFESAARTSNQGNGIIDRGAVTDISVLNDHGYELAFSVVGGLTTYAINDTTTGSTVSTGNVFSDGAGITIAGQRVTITGAPANGDQFTLKPSTHRSLFSMVNDAATALERAGTGDAADNARRSNEISAAIMDLDQGLNRLNEKRGQFGLALQQLDNLQSQSADRDLLFQTELSGLRDIDYAKTISAFLASQQSLQAAQSSFARISQGTLFDVL
jgi:flagellar hook-associated protein 3 FlgL